jgi:hypothetical protein
VTDTLSTILSLIGNTPGVPDSTKTVIERIASSMNSSAQSQISTNGGTLASGAGAKARIATTHDKAVIKVVRVNRARTIVSARIACPKAGLATCVTSSRVLRGSTHATAAKRVRLRAASRRS